jgi:hypothetical protein
MVELARDFAVLEERSGNGELGPRGGEERQRRPRTCCRAPTTSTWPVRASASPRPPNYDFVSVDLIGRPCPVRAALRGE